MKKRTWYYLGAAALVILAVVLFFALRSPSPGGTYDNLIVNGDFEQLNNQGMPVSWYTDSYAGANYTNFTLAEGMEGNGVQIENIGPNDARFAQVVSVSPNTLYHLHGYIKADAQGGRGANLSIEWMQTYSDTLYNTQGEWQEVSLYGRTGPDQTGVTVYVRLGGYSGESTGIAVFDQITLNRVDNAPSDAWVSKWYQDYTVDHMETQAPKTAALQLILFSGAYGLLFYLALPFLRTKRDELQPNRKKAFYQPWYILAAILTLGAACRLFIAASVPGYDVDIGCFTSWGTQFTHTGPAEFYQFYENYGGHCDYPPGYILILGAIGYLGRAFGGVSELMVKLPPILCDLALCLLIYTEGKKYLSEKASLALSCLYAFNPLVLVTGSAWGQADAVLTLFIVLTVIYALKGKWKIALPVYVVSILVKPQALMFGPLGLIAFLMHIIKSWKDEAGRTAVLKDALIGLGAALIAAALIIVPFSLKRDGLSWLVTLYSETMVQYNYVTINACNIYFLLGKNWISAGTNISGEAVMLLAVYFLSILPLVAAALMDPIPIQEKWRSKGGKLRLLILGGLAAVLGLLLMLLALTGVLTYSLLGSLMIGYAVMLMGALYVLGNDPRNLPLLGAVLLMMLYCTGSMMHERYLFPCISLLWLAYMLKKDKRILYLAIAITITGFLNVGCVLDRNIRIGGFEAHLDAPGYAIESDMAWLEYLTAGVNCLVCGLSIMAACLITQKEAVPALLSRKKTSLEKEQAAAVKRLAPPRDRQPRPRLKKWDYILMLSITAAYAVLAFTNLGSIKAPQNPWVSKDSGEQILIDFGESRQFNMYYYGGIHSYDLDFTVETSQDGERWENHYLANVSVGDCFKWKVVGEYSASPYPALLSGRYVRISANHFALTLFETLFRDAVTDESLPILSITSTVEGSNPAALVDEPDTMEGDPGSWYNSTYFDEIYHARTGYEHLHGMQPYETTHPPLGKVLMSWCIAIFGMTPFGWRFAGALAGVLMLPGMYLLGHILIKKKWGGLGAMLLMAFDLMHFTQTRIATIDSFVVLFIIWEVYFMLRWFYLDYFKTPFLKTLLPLFLSGLCMGLAIASKWTGVYAAVGLAVILFFGLWRRYREILWAKKIAPKKRTKEESIAAEDGIPRLLLTIASCFVLFIFIPLLIYYLSYIPYFASSGGVTVDKVIRAAVGDYFKTGQMGGMLGYHGQPGFGMDHRFYSPWYQWPVIGKPMFYFQSLTETPGMQSTIMAMGNPAVWWTGLIALFGVIALWAMRHVTSDRTLSLHTETDDPRYAILMICFAAQYMPWVLVPRGTYIYHYFPSVPFIILCVMLCLDWLGEKWEKAAKIALIVLLIVSAVLFIGFFPYASGVEVSQSWLDMMNWFPSWLYY